MSRLTAALRAEYQKLFDTAVIRPRHQAAVEALAARIEANRSHYDAIEAELAIPWHVVGLIHALEASPPLSMKGHLHNGDPLTARTVHVPAGRPQNGSPPFSWTESALDALRVEKFHQWRDWSVPGTLYKLERYNGWGYRRYHPEVLSPYLWSFTMHYDRGKYLADGRFSDSARSKQCGAAAILRRLMEQGVVEHALAHTPLIRFEHGETELVTGLQRFLNTCPGVTVKVDGKPGPRSSAALQRVTGHFLLGDPRETGTAPTT